MKYKVIIIRQLQCERSWKLHKLVWSVDLRTLNCFGRSALVMFVALQSVRNLEHACSQDEKGLLAFTVVSIVVYRLLKIFNMKN